MDDTRKAAADEAAEAAAKAAELAADLAADAGEAIKDGIDAAHRFLKAQLKERPGVTLAAAAVAGVVLGLLISGRRD